MPVAVLSLSAASFTLTAPLGHIHQLVYANPVENLDEGGLNLKC